MAEKMTIKWRLLKYEKPTDGQHCHISSDETFHPCHDIITNVPWHENLQVFVSLFATSAAGSMYSEANGVTLWVPADELDVISGIPDEPEGKE